MNEIVLKRQQASSMIQTTDFKYVGSSTKFSRSLRMDGREDVVQHQQLDTQHSSNPNNSNRILKHFRIALRDNEQRTHLSEDEKEQGFKWLYAQLKKFREKSSINPLLYIIPHN